MDSERFDALTRSLSSRRSALGGAVGALAGLLGLALPEEAEAHNFLARCRRIQDPARRRACLRRARAHNLTCHPQPVTTTCTGRCGVWPNNCGTAVGCTCPAGRTCLENGSCARACGGDLGPCPEGCFCGIPVGGGTRCTVHPSNFNSCTLPLCESTVQCPVGWTCQQWQDCDENGVPENRCFPLCPG